MSSNNRTVPSAWNLSTNFKFLSEFHYANITSILYAAKNGSPVQVKSTFKILEILQDVKEDVLYVINQ